jgi:hypothetical protein
MSCAAATGRGAGWAGRGGWGHLGRVGQGGWGWAGGDVPWWTVKVFEPNGLCLLEVRNKHGL